MLHQELSAPGREGREEELTAGPSVSAGKLLIRHPPETTPAAQQGLHSHRIFQTRCQTESPAAWIFLTSLLNSERGRTGAEATSHAFSPLTADG